MNIKKKSKIPWHKFDEYCRQGLKTQELAELTGYSKGSVSLFVKKRGIHREWRTAWELRNRRKKKKDKGWKIRFLEALLDEMESRGYKVERGELLKEMKIEGFIPSIHRIKKPAYSVTKKYPKHKYYIWKAYAPRQFDVALLPDGQVAMRLPCDRQWWNIKAVPDQSKLWPTKAAFRAARSQRRVDQMTRRVAPAWWHGKQAYLERVRLERLANPKPKRTRKPGRGVDTSNLACYTKDLYAYQEKQ